MICTLNARTAILASANPVESRYNPGLSVIENIKLPPTLLSRFDLIYLVRAAAEGRHNSRRVMLEGDPVLCCALLCRTYFLAPVVLVLLELRRGRREREREVFCSHVALVILFFSGTDPLCSLRRRSSSRFVNKCGISRGSPVSF